MKTFATALCLIPLLACVAAAQPQPSDIAVPYGIHGPTYSHLHDAPDVWSHSQTIFDSFHQIGVDWARMDAWWSLVEPERGQFDFDYWDRVMDSYAENDIKLMVILCYGAAWEAGAGPITDEARAAFGDYVFQMVRRYRGTVREWEIWNEPNILPFWAPEPNVEDYATLLIEAYRRAKEADPTCVIVGGATAGADFDFVDGIFANGAGHSFDVLSYHTYGNRPTRDGAEAEVAGLRRILDENGRSDAPIWLSEHGIFTGPGGVSPREQARDIVRCAIWRLNAGVERCVYLSMRDWFATDDTANARDFWGFLTADGTPKESFFALRTFSSAIANRDLRGEIHLGPGVEAFLWGGLHDNAMVIWADEETEITLDLGVAHVLTQTLTGEENLLTSDDRQFTLALRPDPLWLHNVGENMVLLAGVRSEPVIVARGETADMDVEWINPLNRPVEITLDANPPEGIAVRGTPFRSVLPPNGDVQFPLSVEVADDAPVETIDLPLVFTVNGALLPIGEAVHHASVKVADPFSVAQLVTDSLDDQGLYPLRFEITNHTDENIMVECSLSVGEMIVSQGVNLEVGAGQEGMFSLSIDLANFAPGDLANVVGQFTANGHTVTIEDSLRLFLAPRATGDIVIDGLLSEWTAAPTLPPDQFTEEDFNPNLNGGSDDIEVTAWAAWSEEGLWLAVRVHDDVVLLPADHMIWDFDGLQIAFDTLNDAMPNEGFGPDDIEVEIGLLRDGSTKIFAGQFPPGRIEDIVPEETELAITHDGNTISYEMFFPAAVLDPFPFEEGAMVGLCVIHNDNDGDGREGWSELSPGIGWGKMPSEYPTLVLMP